MVDVKGCMGEKSGEMKETIGLGDLFKSERR
jgi:hypothetical protein